MSLPVILTPHPQKKLREFGNFLPSKKRDKKVFANDR
jgi:hypothetical protein